MSRARTTALLFGVCCLAVAGAMAWLTVEMLRLERREAEAKTEAVFQESVRLALWRMESALAPLLAQEASRPPEHYMSFATAVGAYTKGLSKVGKGEVVVASPLLAEEPPFCLLHFQIDADGTLSSPRVPKGRMRDLALGVADPAAAYCSVEQVTEAERLLARAAAIAAPLRTATLGPVQLLTQPSDAVEPASTPQPPQQPQGQSSANLPQAAYQAAAGQQELAQRRQSAEIALNSNLAQTANDPDVPQVQGALRPIWLPDPSSVPQLLLVRSVRLDHASGTAERRADVLQAVWLDWNQLSSNLLGRVASLLPHAALRQHLRDDDASGMVLAGIPATLDPGPRPLVVIASFTPTRITLAVAWLAVVGAAAAIGFVLRAATDLGERRGRFVSAVTHELRTPLTTFCLYSQMLADGMVTEDEPRRQYLATLQRESQRLARIVENVLCYARLSDIRAPVRTERISAVELLDRIMPALARRTAEAGMRLHLDSEAANHAAVEVDPQTVERILMNLVDNACKYAGHGPDPAIQIAASAKGPMVQIDVADHGPGIPATERARLFTEFNRGARDAASGAPGLGLGLSLARGLARELGGDLRLEQRPGFGAVFVLSLPAAHPR